MSFAHLHLHSQYSLLDGAIRLDDLFPRALELGMHEVAITDHGNLYGALQFYRKAKEHGVKPIFGCETYVAPHGRFDRQTRKSFHLILLARDATGYHNLSYLVSMAHLEGYYQHPRIDKKLLHDRRAGLIGMSACLGGEIAQTLMKDGPARAREVAREYRDLFEDKSFFLEVQPNGLAEQEQVNAALVKIAGELGIGLVATNDCHYLRSQDAHAHEVLMCIQTGKSMNDKGRMHHRVEAYYLKSPAEMDAYFSHLPEAMENTERIAAMCNVEIDLTSRHLPKYEVPAGQTAESFLGDLARVGLVDRLRELRERGRHPDLEEYQERLGRELDVICRMGFAGYFLIVADFIRHARTQGIPVGPGRGSGAGSLVAYSLGITDLDPIEHKLLFERFLNPERVSMPDFDVDFCMKRRDEIIRYVAGRYGQDNVGQIVTMHRLHGRQSIRDVARVMAYSYGEADRIAKLVPPPIQGRHISLRDAIAQEPRLHELYDKDVRIKELLDVAVALEGLNRHAGVHAAGVVIAEKPLWEYVPCFRADHAKPDSSLVTQFEMKEVELAGLVKFDFLGLKTLTVLDTAVHHINAQREGAADGAAPFRLADIRLDDAKVFELIARADTAAVFQMESSGFREMLKRLRPDRFEDIVAAVALYRPGPMDWIDDFCRRKHGQVQVTYLHPLLEPILCDTYGVIVYQEQVMQIASSLAGYSLGRADLLRRAMGKKSREAMDAERAPFIEGCLARGVDARAAAQIFDMVQPFADYAFNRSHAACYALLAYQTAYLKAHYPVEFMAAVLSCERGEKQDKLAGFIAEARTMGIEVRRPDVNESEADFSCVRFRDGRKVIRFGLGAVKNVGEAAVGAILEARGQAGPFTGLLDFCERVDLRRVNKKVIESLVKAGACDGIARAEAAHRAQLFQDIERVQELAGAAQRDRESGQANLFGLASAGAPSGTARSFGYSHAPEWSPKELLGFEREALGFYITGHPLDRYQDDLKRYTTATTANLEERSGRTPVALGGIVTELRDKLLKSGRRMAFFTLEDQTGSVECIAFSDAFEKSEEVLRSDEPLLVRGRVQVEGEDGVTEARLFVDEAVRLSQVRQEKTRSVHLHLNADVVGRAELERLQNLLGQHAGDCPVVLHMEVPKRSETVIELPRKLAVRPTDELLLALERLFGQRVAVLN